MKTRSIAEFESDLADDNSPDIRLSKEELRLLIDVVQAANAHRAYCACGICGFCVGLDRAINAGLFKEVDHERA
jgi:hypothetical protein